MIATAESPCRLPPSAPSVRTSGISGMPLSTTTRRRSSRMYLSIGSSIPPSSKAAFSGAVLSRYQGRDSITCSISVAP